MKVPKSISNILQPIVSQFSNPRPNSILYNRGVLYFVFLITLFQLYTFSVAGKLQNIAVFLLVGFLTSFFSKNMTVIMVIALVFTELVNAGVKTSRFEGMTEGAEDKPSDKPKHETVKPPSETQPDEKPKEESTEKDKTEKPTPEELKKVQTELQENQARIIQGFQEIEPFMQKAEQLVGQMNEYAKV